VNLIDQIAKVLVSGQADREDTMDQNQTIVARLIGLLRLHANVKEAHAIVQLVAWGDGLAANGRCGQVACRAVVSSRYGKC